MLLHSVIIILREVLESALLMSAMLSLSYYLKIPLSWLKWAIILGLIGAILYASNITFVSNMLEGVGQEIINALLQYLIYLLLAGFCIYLLKTKALSLFSLNIIRWVMIISVSLSMTREFSEILIYLQIIVIDPQHSTAIMIGALLGASIGLSIGIIFYHLLNYLSEKRSFTLIIIVLSFIAAGMLSQATQLLIQADWLPSQQPLWDSSALISERSLVGQLLYAIFGYEATPSLIQVCVHFSGLLLILFYVTKQNHFTYTEQHFDKVRKI